MNQADLCCINNEFAISDRGEKLAGKAYTFRAKPQNISYLKEMGADLVTLATTTSTTTARTPSTTPWIT